MIRSAEKLYLLLTAIIAWLGLILQQFILIKGVPGNGLTITSAIGRFLLYFTILSNLLVAIVLTARLLSQGGIKNGSLFGAMTVYIMVVGITYNAILRPLWSPQGWQRVCDEVLHVAIPVLTTIYWIVFVPKGTLRWQHPFYWLVFPAIYLGYALLRGHNEGFYPYAFIDLNVLGASNVIINCSLVLLLLLVSGSLIVFADRQLAKRPKTNL